MDTTTVENVESEDGRGVYIPDISDCYYTLTVDFVPGVGMVVSPDVKWLR